MQPIDTNEFISERTDDIREIEIYLESRKKKSMAFQKLPHHKRRRTGSFAPIRRRNRKRSKDEWTFLHKYFAKRFKMVTLNKISLPLERNQKSHSLLHKGKNFLFLTGLKCYIYRINDQYETLKSNFSSKEAYENIDFRFFQNLSEIDIENSSEFHQSKNNFNFYSPEKFSNQDKSTNFIFKNNDILIILTFQVLPSFFQQFLLINKSDNVFQVLKQENEIKNSVLKIKTVKKTEEMNISDYFDDYERSGDNMFFLRLVHTFPFMIVFSDKPESVTQYLTYNFFFISIYEYVRLYLEYLMVPLYFRRKDLFEEFEKAIETEKCKKWWRTPTGKRPNFLSSNENIDLKKELENKTVHADILMRNQFIFPFKLPELNIHNIFIFKTAHGVLEKGSRVYIKKDQEKKLIGYVLNGQFSFRLGVFVGFFSCLDFIKRENNDFFSIDEQNIFSETLNGKKEILIQIYKK